MEDLKGLICIIHSLNGKLLIPKKFYPIPSTIHDYGEQIMIMGTPNFVFFDKTYTYNRMLSMPIIYFDERNPEHYIDELTFIGTPVFTMGEIITIKPSRECKISIHRYALKKFIFIVLVDEIF